MKWEKSAETLKNAILSNIKGPIRPLAARSITKAAERERALRGSPSITEQDLLRGIFKATPPVFLPRIEKNLASLGVDYERYLTASPQKKCLTDPKHLSSDLLSISKSLQIPFHEQRVNDAVEAFAEFIQSSPISFSIQIGRRADISLHARYIDIGTGYPDPLTRAKEIGLIGETSHSMYHLFDESKELFDVSGYGAELNVSLGLSKLYVFLSPSAVESLYVLGHLPPGAKRCANHFSRYSLNHFTVLGIDIIEETVELVILVRTPTLSTPKKILALLDEIELYPDSNSILDHCTGANIVVYTFSWELDVPRSISFRRFNVGPTPSHGAFHPMLTTAVAVSALSAHGPPIVFGVTLSRNGPTFSIDNDYNGKMAEILSRALEAGV